MPNHPKILVVGSFVMDLILSAPRFPSSGESVIGTSFSTAPGGKGANQAVQASRLGAKVTMAGRVGNDDFGKALIKSANDSGVDTKYVTVSPSTPTAIGNIQLQVKESGTENRIMVYPGANMEITVDDMAFLEKEINAYNMVVLQNEIPTEVNTYISSIAKKANVPVLLNPAPSSKLPSELISNLTFIAPNEHEAKDLTGIEPGSEQAIENQLYAIRDMGAENVIITLGKRGAAFLGDNGIAFSQSVDCGRVVDPTAAGDSFIGAFATAVAAGIPVSYSLVFANYTAGITVTRMGAQTSLPDIDEVLNLMAQKGYDSTPFRILKEG